MPLWTMVAGAWRPVKQPQVLVAGAWRPVTNAWVLVAGAWRPCYAMSAPSSVTANDTSFCDTTIPHYQIEVDFVPFNSSYPVRVEYSTDGGFGWSTWGEAFAGDTSVTADADNTATYNFRCYHIVSLGGAQLGPTSGATSNFTVSPLTCF